MEDFLICRLFEGIPRQGPGDNEHTEKAFRMIPKFPENAKILDIGCGKGMQTIALAKLCPECHVTATDIYQPFLDALSKNAKEEGLSERITTICASMDNLPFEKEEFDIIWAEGSIFITGFENGINYWKKFLKHGGYMSVSDLVKFKEVLSKDVTDFLNQCSPDILNEEETLLTIKKAGLETIAMFKLPENVWHESFYNYMKENNKILREEYKDNPDALSIIDFNDLEINVYSKHADEYGYTYFIIKKP
ncbi:class I SAM-dependent methyltransferase [Methanomicrobium antiquum]|uniref:Class I SAM-dependent methyltransferase n=1 Tax=Methanomicrobium antiquum TaxID=487686 RepID=A0AAF0FNZ1_9EURY|nr:class I SAM-dependent methyltransferase [Methanomicrobium antiquum]WFN36960.1 class I SAM-dependent methyltransferase [Methanomicrobium antiquum]